MKFVSTFSSVELACMTGMNSGCSQGTNLSIIAQFYWLILYFDLGQQNSKVRWVFEGFCLFVCLCAPCLVLPLPHWLLSRKLFFLAPDLAWGLWPWASDSLWGGLSQTCGFNTIYVLTAPGCINLAQSCPWFQFHVANIQIYLTSPEQNFPLKLFHPQFFQLRQWQHCSLAA